MSLIPGVRIDPRLRIDPWIGFTPDVSSGLLKCTRSGTTAKLLRMMDLTARIRHNMFTQGCLYYLYRDAALIFFSNIHVQVITVQTMFYIPLWKIEI